MAIYEVVCVYAICIHRGGTPLFIIHLPPLKGKAKRLHERQGKKYKVR